MASPTLKIISFFVAIFTTCNCEYSLPPSHLYGQSQFSLGTPGNGPVVYVPTHEEPLQDHGQAYHPQVYVGQQYHQSGQQYHQSGQHYQHLGGISQKESGRATVYQQNNHHGSEQKHSVHHHGSGVSHQVFKQEHQQSDLSSQGQDHGYDHSEAEHHKKDHNIHYQFEYSVNDHKTGDVKRHKEERKGDVVNGEYSLLEEDGNVRTVKYYADWKTGFHAQVHNSKAKSG